MSHRNHKRGMKHYSGTGKSKTLKERTIQAAIEFKRANRLCRAIGADLIGITIGEFPDSFKLRKVVVNEHTGQTAWL